MIKVQTIKELSNISCDAFTMVCGNFDGIHRGHKKLIQEASNFNKNSNKNSKLVLFTFFPNPKAFFQTNNYIPIYSQEKKEKVLKSLGIDILLEIKFDKKLSLLSPKQFLKQYLNTYNEKIYAIFVGSLWRFGNQAKGNLATLKHFFHDKVHGINELIFNENKISSTTIRQQLKEGNISLVNELLGQAYTIEGEVVNGEKIAHTQLEVPTANIYVKNFLIPTQGIFIIKVYYQNNTYDGICNIGYTPTIKLQVKKKIEAHIFNFEQNIYKEKLTIELIKKIRDEKKFDSINELKEQIKLDIKQCANFLSKE